MDQEAICRVCRCEGTDEQPLFYPCKCSGSIRYVHQECLMEWLSHSRKKYCELCEHPYKFSPVYRTDMPENIPLSLFIIQLGKKITNMISMLLRVCLVTCVWLFILPYFTVTVWRFYFWSGKVLSSQILRLQQMTNHSIIMHLYQSSINNNTSTTTLNNGQTVTSTIASALAGYTLESIKATGATLATNQTLSKNESSILPLQYNIFGISFTAADIKTILLDCFQGQLITCVVVIVFIAMFHLREWIVQNIPDELLEDGDNNIIVDDINIDQDINVPLNENHDIQQQGDEEVEQEEVEVEMNYTTSERQDLEHAWYLTTRNIDVEYETTDEPRRSLRTASEPPPSINFTNSDSNDHNNNQHIMWQRRGTSAEPQLESWQDILYNESSRYTAETSFGRPPHAPRLRHAQTVIDHEATNSAFDNHSFSSQPPLPTVIDLTDENNETHELLENSFNGHQNNHPNDIHQANLPPFQLGQQPLLEEEENEREDDEEEENENEIEDEDDVDDDEDNEEDDDDVEIQVQQQPNENEDENGADEILDVLDAVGMRGSLWTLVQNLVLIALLISLCLGASVWMPYLIGMTFVMADLFDLVRIPLLITRMITDPIIDWLISFSINMVWPTVISTTETIYSTLSDYYASLTPESLQHVLNIIYKNSISLLDDLLSTASTSTVHNSTIIHNSTTITGTGINNYINEGFTTVLHLINQVEPTTKAIVTWYKHLAVGTSAMDRLMCIVIGYFVVLVMSSSYLSRTVAQVIFGDRAEGTLRQQFLILKVGMFLTIELFMFPVACGILLNISIMPLFSVTGSKWRVVQYILDFPVTATFVHWIVGTSFMFLFALLITSCRNILRPGVMWFIRDPNNPQFHPIKEIVERPVWDQLKKLGASGIMYTIIVIVGVGGVIHAIPFLMKDMLPLQWNSSKTLSAVPFDLILLQIAIPAAIRYFKPKRLIKALSVKWMKYLCRQLRLTSFMFGIRRFDEEGIIRYSTWSEWFKSWFSSPVLFITWTSSSTTTVSSTSGIYEWNGQMVRAPKHDGVKFIPGRRMLIPIDPVTLLPLDERERLLGHPASRGDGGEAANTVIVYTPPRFRQRVLLFIILLWLSGSLFLCSFTILPIFIGRLVFKNGFNVTEPIHDIYAFAIGGIIMLILGTIITRVVLAVKDAISEANPNTRLIRFFKHLYQLCTLGFKWVFFITNFGVIIPILLGSIMELYFIFPIRDFGDKMIVFDFLPLWARGFVCMNILHGTLRVLANPLQANLRSAFRRGITEMNIKFVFTHILMQIYLGCLSAIVFPLAIAYINIKLWEPEGFSNQIKLIQTMYPITLLGFVAYHIMRAFTKLIDRWVQNIREDHYLVGQTLHNMED